MSRKTQKPALGTKSGKRNRIQSISAVLATFALASGLAACTSASASDESEAGNADGFGSVTVQLSWLKNHEFAGFFNADHEGFFEEAGFENVEFLPGGMGGTPAATAIISDKAWIGIASPTDIAAANAEGADLKIVANTYQKNPFTLVSATTDPINEPQDLLGKTIAIADSSATNWDAFLKINDIDPDSIDRVPYGDAQNDLKLGNIDGFMGYGDGGSPLRAEGFDAQEFYLADFGLAYAGESVVVAADTLENEREKVTAFITAWARGWHSAFADVDAALELVLNDYGKDQNYSLDELQLWWENQEYLILTDTSLEEGIGIITDEALQENLDTLAVLGFDFDPDQLFDTELIREVYAANPDLIIGAES